MNVKTGLHLGRNRPQRAPVQADEMKYSTDGYRLTKQGIRCLDAPKKGEEPAAAEVVTDPTDIIHYDIIYSSEPRRVILDRFPHARIDDVYEETRGHMLDITLNCTRDEWYGFLIREGLSDISLVFQMDLVMKQDRVTRVMDKIFPGWDKEVKRAERMRNK